MVMAAALDVSSSTRVVGPQNEEMRDWVSGAGLEAHQRSHSNTEKTHGEGGLTIYPTPRAKGARVKISSTPHVLIGGLYSRGTMCVNTTFAHGAVVAVTDTAQRRERATCIDVAAVGVVVADGALRAALFEGSRVLHIRRSLPLPLAGGVAALVTVHAGSSAQAMHGGGGRHCSCCCWLPNHGPIRCEETRLGGWVSAVQTSRCTSRRAPAVLEIRNALPRQATTMPTWVSAHRGGGARRAVCWPHAWRPQQGFAVSPRLVSPPTGPREGRAPGLMLHAVSRHAVRWRPYRASSAEASSA